MRKLIINGTQNVLFTRNVMVTTKILIINVFTETVKNIKGDKL